MDQGSPMTNRSAPLACLSPAEQARRVALGLNGRHRGARPAAGPMPEPPAALAPPADPWPGAPLDPWALVPGI
jgi:hypothetical protein